jgi:penicillin-binding protein 1A
MLRFILNFFGAIFSAITLGIFAVAVSIGAIFWVYARDLPSTEQLAQYAPPTISRIYSGEGRLIDEFAQERRLFVPIEEVPDLVKQAFISAEDKNFYNHAGYDPRSMAAAFYEAIESRGQNVRGASTITQQVMKNFLLSSDRSAERKIKEIVLASRIEETLSKDRILELYLNEIFLGQNSFGVAAAAQTYFNATLQDLTVAQAAMLAALPQAPSNYHPVRNRDRLLARRNNYVLVQMLDNGYITRDQFDEARADLMQTVQAGDIEPFRAQMPPRDYFTDEIRRQLSANFGEAEFFGGGLQIRATVDPELQTVAARALRTGLENPRRHFPALVAAPGARGAGRVHGDGREHRPRDRHAGRLQLPAFGLQPRHAGNAPAGIGLQALRLCRGAGQRVHARHHHHRRPDRGGTPQGIWRPTNASNRFYGPTPCAPGSSSRAT